MLDHQGLADHFHIDRHAGSVIGDRCSAADVIGRAAALIFRFGKAEQPLGYVYFVDGHRDDVTEGGRRQELFAQDHIIHLEAFLIGRTVRSGFRREDYCDLEGHRNRDTTAFISAGVMYINVQATKNNTDEEPAL